MASSSTRAASLSAYRQLISLIKALPESQQPHAMKQLRDGFVRNRDAPESDVPSLLKDGLMCPTYMDYFLYELSVARHSLQIDVMDMSPF
eukprot:CAMPEP_0116016840 /NCGR_PEP_ID=MMETSP0321-20121206/7710_1 /TAXON_ID=163516 /ORGANISM="Leptocylindrus danicus var. danicus, Strain B650" /LENGTH=89 /DNA_ID=CAMNT_0003486955 /DNA_START=25 /DNA_END=295 /DNA_ORIENTATION=+